MIIRILRQLYFWLFLTINAIVFGITFKGIDFMALGFSESVSYLSLPLGTIALFGFSYSVHIYKQWLWIAVVSVILLNDVIYGGYYFISETIKYTQNSGFSISDIKYPLVTLSLFVPYWAGISLYAFSRKFWQTPNETKSKVVNSDKTVRTTAYAYKSNSIPDSEYSKYGVNEDTHVVLPLDLMKCEGSNGQRVNFPRPQGMSGSPVVVLYESEHGGSRTFPVVAVAIEYRKNDKVVIATDVKYVIEAIENAT